VNKPESRENLKLITWRSGTFLTCVINARPFVWGSFVWNMFDFAVAGRNEGGVPCRNDKVPVSSAGN
jgi:hypothetical protein